MQRLIKILLLIVLLSTFMSRVAKAQKNEIDSLLNESIKNHEKKEFKKNINVLTKAYELAKKERKTKKIKDISGKIGYTYLLLDSLKKAEKFYKKHLNLSEDTASGDIYVLGECNYILGNYDEALKHLNKYIKIKPKDVDARKIIMKIHSYKNNKKKAEEQLNILKRIAPEDTFVLKSKANYELAYGSCEEGLRAFKEYIKISNRLPSRWHLALYCSFGKDRKTLTKYILKRKKEEGLSNHHDSLIYFKYSFYFHMKQKDTSKVFQSLEVLKNLRPFNNDTLYSHIINTCMINDKPDMTFEYIENFKENANTKILPIFFHTYALNYFGDYEKALDLIKKHRKLFESENALNTYFAIKQNSYIASGSYKDYIKFVEKTQKWNNFSFPKEKILGNKAFIYFVKGKYKKWALTMDSTINYLKKQTDLSFNKIQKKFSKSIIYQANNKDIKNKSEWVRCKEVSNNVSFCYSVSHKSIITNSYFFYNNNKEYNKKKKKALNTLKSKKVKNSISGPSHKILKDLLNS